MSNTTTPERYRADYLERHRVMERCRHDIPQTRIQLNATAINRVSETAARLSVYVAADETPHLRVTTTSRAPDGYHYAVSDGEHKGKRACIGRHPIDDVGWSGGDLVVVENTALPETIALRRVEVSR